MGDKITINNIPTLTINSYSAGTNLAYEVPTPSTLTLSIDKGKYFAFQVNDVLKMQSKLPEMDIFSNDAAMQMKIAIDSTVIFNTYTGAAAANIGATAGAKSGSYNLGTYGSPLTLSASNTLSTLTAMSGVLDEQNVPESDRWCVIDPATRQWLMQSNLAQAQFMGDSKSMVRNGKIGEIDRLTVYVSNQMPVALTGTTVATSGDGTETATVTTGTGKRRIILCGHKSAISFASQMTKVEQVRNPNDFGDFVRGLNVYGYTVAKDTSLTYAVVV